MVVLYFLSLWTPYKRLDCLQCVTLKNLVVVSLALAWRTTNSFRLNSTRHCALSSISFLKGKFRILYMQAYFHVSHRAIYQWRHSWGSSRLAEFTGARLMQVNSFCQPANQKTILIIPLYVWGKQVILPDNEYKCLFWQGNVRNKAIFVSHHASAAMTWADKWKD